jgi:hypothetical protein
MIEPMFASGCAQETIYQVRYAHGENWEWLAAELGEKPEEQREAKAEDEAGNDGEIEGGVFTAVDDVAREFTEAEGEFGAEVQESAD